MAYNHEWPYVDPNIYNDDWLINKVKELSNEWKDMKKQFDELNASFDELEAYVKNYFDNLNISSEINAKIDAMIADGSFQEIVNSQVKPTLRAFSNAVWFDDYLTLGTSNDDAFKAAYNAVGERGTIYFPPGRALMFNETFVLDKPITLKGLGSGKYDLEGVLPPNSMIDIQFTGLQTGILIKSEHVSIEDLVIACSSMQANESLISCASTDNNVPLRKLILRNVYLHNGSPTQDSNAFYSPVTLLLSLFENVSCAGFGYGFKFTATINTSLSFIRCQCSCSQYNYYLHNGQYCSFTACGAESTAPIHFLIDSCKAIMMEACYSEQCTNIVLRCLNTILSINGFFFTSGQFCLASLSQISISGLEGLDPGSPAKGAIATVGGHLTTYNSFAYYRDSEGSINYVAYNGNNVQSIGNAALTLSECSIANESVYLYGNELIIQGTLTITGDANIGYPYQPIFGLRFPIGDGVANVLNNNITFTNVASGTYQIFWRIPIIN